MTEKYLFRLCFSGSRYFYYFVFHGGQKRVGDAGETYYGMREMSKARRDTRRSLNLTEMERSKLPFVVKDPTHAIIERLDGGVVDFWLSSGKWFDRTSKDKGKSIKKLLEHLKREDQLDE